MPYDRGWPRSAAPPRSGLADLLLIVFGGLFLAARPSLYCQGFLLLLPPGGSRERVAGALEASATALRRWLVGQLVAMLVVSC